MKKRLLSLMLAVVLVVGLLPAASAAGTAFTDVADAQLSARIELLRSFGVINGYPDGTFRPNNTLTRAEFTKMTVTLLGGAKACETFGAYTIFGDVPSTDWAAKYINYAARDTEKGGLGLIKGYTDGSFRPSNPISYAEAVTIVLRGLGYSDADVGYNWPRDFVDKAASTGLSKQISLANNASLSRTDAVNLFYNAMFVANKSGDKLIDGMYGEKISSALILSVDADGVRIAERIDDKFVNAAGVTAADVGTRKKLTLNSDGDTVMIAEAAKQPTSTINDAFIYSVSTEDGLTYVSLDGVNDTVCVADIDDSWVGRGAKLTTDTQSGVVIRAERSDERYRTVAFAYYSENRVTSIDGEVFTVPATATTYVVRDGETGAATTFGAVRDDLSYGDTLELTLGADGSAKRVVARTGAANVEVLKPGMTETQLRTALGANADAKIYKNGAETSFSALADYDVASHQPGSGVINICGFRLSAVYTYATPNTTAPEKITVFDNRLTLAPCAQESISKIQPNTKFTLLFAADGRVAGGIDSGNIRAVGVYDGSSSVSFIGGPTLEMTVDAAQNELVSITCDANGKVIATRVSERAANKPLDLEAMTLGDTPVAVGCVFFERATKGQTPVRVDPANIRVKRIAASDILHVSYDAAGRANLIILGDVTGDGYTYGRVIMTTEEEEISGGTLSAVYDKRIITLTNSAGSAAHDVAQTTQIPSSVLKVSDPAAYRRYYEWGGIALGNVDSPSGVREQVTAYRPLNVTRDADRTTFVGSSAVKIDGELVPIAAGVQVYLDKTGVFMKRGEFATDAALVSAARAQSDKFELLLDAAPSDGGKVRVIVVK